MIRHEARYEGDMLQLKPEGLAMADAMSRPVAVCGRQLIADNSGALYLPGQCAMLVAALQLGSDWRGGAASGEVRRVLIKLAEAIDRYEPAKVIVLADSVHDGGREPASLSAEDLQVLHILQEDREWIW